jgi:hypothetical protein
VSLRRSSRRRRSTGDNGPKVSHYLLSRYLYILIIINNTAARARKKSLLDCIKLSWLPILRFSSEIAFSEKTIRGARITRRQVTACNPTSCAHLHMGTCRQMACVLVFF